MQAKIFTKTATCPQVNVKRVICFKSLPLRFSRQDEMPLQRIKCHYVLPQPLINKAINGIFK
ncbi:hypothetical protein EM595_1987 [Duffyella gerundensis]|jgi:hypothetical protein|uniref:Uncharacterized protein n=1 Tax=Duffyella gerundensis TaxID=1619313 RepID=A0A0U5EAG5_9GAMM|nr:hypothetical protein EM595_1987 [Duffyella gerundensis]